MAATVVEFETLSLKINYFFSALAFEFGCHGKLEQDNSTTQLPMLLVGRDSLLPWREAESDSKKFACSLVCLSKNSLGLFIN